MNTTKVIELCQQIDKLSNEIKNIEKQAHVLANCQTKVELTLQISNLSTMEDEKSKARFDEDGSLIPPSHIIMDFVSMEKRIMRMYGMPDHTIKYENKDTEFKLVVNDTGALSILGIVLAEKQKDRDAIVRELTKLGVKL